jgi:hypothetical protein
VGNTVSLKNAAAMRVVHRLVPGEDGSLESALGGYAQLAHPAGDEADSASRGSDDLQRGGSSSTSSEDFHTLD